jgi:hypothetical protein
MLSNNRINLTAQGTCRGGGVPFVVHVMLLTKEVSSNHFLCTIYVSFLMLVQLQLLCVQVPHGLCEVIKTIPECFFMRGDLDGCDHEWVFEYLFFFFFYIPHFFFPIFHGFFP